MASLQMPPFEPIEQEAVWDYTIALADATYHVQMIYRERQESWYLNLFDGEDKPIVSGIRLTVQHSGPLEKYRLEDFPDDEYIYLLDLEGKAIEADFDSLGFRTVPMHENQSDFEARVQEVATELGVDLANFATERPVITL